MAVAIDKAWWIGAAGIGVGILIGLVAFKRRPEDEYDEHQTLLPPPPLFTTPTLPIPPPRLPVPEPTIPQSNRVTVPEGYVFTSPTRVPESPTVASPFIQPEEAAVEAPKHEFFTVTEGTAPSRVTRSMKVKLGAPRETRCNCQIKEIKSKGGSTRYAAVCVGSPMPRYISKELATRWKNMPVGKRCIDMTIPFDAMSGSAMANRLWTGKKSSSM